ncbi:unnamed protein product [Penicillium camemberti]|uniref:Str. FM013 n=1 Tax=Penicillium camemberti (strain FM 013) TaxID=1429867 RepID=A0A0G4P765_PENC3|nr:unnamed protein product [Penicillium camemberti]
MDGTYVNSQPDATFKLSTWAKALPAEELHASYMTTLRSVEARMCATSSNPSLCLQVQQMGVVGRENIPRIFPLPQARPT